MAAGGFMKLQGFLQTLLNRLPLLFLVLSVGSATVFASEEQFVVDSLEFVILDAFDDAKTHTKADRVAYGILNSIHIKTRESVVRRYMIFQKGDTITNDMMVETERLLRRENYISDAELIRVPLPDGRNLVRVQTSDQWTLSVPVSLSNPSGQEWEYQVGILESNLLGYGQALGFYYAHTQERDIKFAEYRNPHFLLDWHTLAVVVATTTDGFAHSASWKYPFLSRSRDQWSYDVSWSTRKLSQGYYYHPDGTVPVQAIAGNDSLPLLNLQDANQIISWEGVRQDTVQVRLRRSFGHRVKFYPGIEYNWNKRRQQGVTRVARFNTAEGSFIPDTGQISTRYPRKGDSRIGVSMGISSVEYLKLVNFRHVKWTEDVNLGWSVEGAFSRNIPQLGADDSRWHYEYFGQYNTAFRESHLLTVQGRGYGYWQDSITDAWVAVSQEYQWKPIPSLSTVISSGADFFQHHQAERQLYLGGDAGLVGYPYYYLPGRARLQAELEQRWFPGFEFGTVLPVFTAYLSAGNAWQSREDIDFNDLYYTAGTGVRFAMSKSTLGVINHLNLSWPLNGPLADGFGGLRFSVTAEGKL